MRRCSVDLVNIRDQNAHLIVRPQVIIPGQNAGPVNITDGWPGVRRRRGVSVLGKLAVNFTTNEIGGMVEYTVRCMM